MTNLKERISELEKEINSLDKYIHEKSPSRCPKCDKKLNSYIEIKKHIKRTNHRGDFQIKGFPRPCELGYPFEEFSIKTAQLKILKEWQKSNEDKVKELKDLFKTKNPAQHTMNYQIIEAINEIWGDGK